MVETPNQFLPLDLSTADLLLRRLDIVEAELEDISRKIREAEDHVEFAMSLGTEAYTGALAYLSALQAERIFLLQKQGELARKQWPIVLPQHRLPMHGQNQFYPLLRQNKKSSREQDD